MTTIIILLAVIAILLFVVVIQFGVFLDRNYNSQIGVDMNLSAINSKAQSILNETAQTNGRIDGFIPAFKKLLERNESIENAWACDITSIIKLLKEIRDINWGKLTDIQKNEILYRLTHPVVESPFKPPFNPTCETTNKED